MRHKRLFVEWLRGSGLAIPGDSIEYTFPVVLFTQSRWLKTEKCSMPVFCDGAELVGYLRRRVKESELFSPTLIDAVAQAVAGVKPLSIAVGRRTRRESEYEKRQAMCTDFRSRRERRATSVDVYFQRENCFQIVSG